MMEKGMEGFPSWVVVYRKERFGIPWRKNGGGNWKQDREGKRNGGGAKIEVSRGIKHSSTKAFYFKLDKNNAFSSIILHV